MTKLVNLGEVMMVVKIFCLTSHGFVYRCIWGSELFQPSQSGKADSGDAGKLPSPYYSSSNMEKKESEKRGWEGYISTLRRDWSRNTAGRSGAQEIKLYLDWYLRTINLPMEDNLSPTWSCRKKELICICIIALSQFQSPPSSF